MNDFKNYSIKFKDGHYEKCIVIRPNGNNYCEFFTQSGLYIFNYNGFYKYHPELLKIEISLTGHCTYYDTDCYLVEESIDCVLKTEDIRREEK